MSKVNFAIGLDIGSGTIKGICALRKKETEQYEIYAKAEVASFGVRRGVVESPEKVAEKVRLLVQEMSHAINDKIQGACININGSRIFSHGSKGNVVIAAANEIITEDDVNRAMEAARVISLTNNTEIIDVFPSQFIVDNEGGIKDPTGMKGTRLEADIMALCAFAPHKRYLTNAVLDADLEIYDIMASPIAASEAVLTPEQKETGVVLVDIGAGTTSMAVFEEGRLIHVAVFPLGSGNITNDIAIGLKIPVEKAEKIKKEFKFKRGGAKPKIKKSKKKNEEADLMEEEDLEISQNYKILERIISLRVQEILTQVRDELKKIGKSASLPGGVVIVGGGAKMHGIIDNAKRILALPCQIGKPRGFLGLDPDPSLAVLCGLIMDRDVEYMDGHSEGGLRWLDKIWESIKKLLKFFIP